MLLASPSRAGEPAPSATSSPSTAATSSPSSRPSPADTQLADLRFQEGKALLDQGAVKEACEKLAQSLALHRRGGTLLNLAACRQREGRAATALQLFQEALDFAKAEGRTDRVEIAQQGMRDVRAGLVWIVITVAPGAAAPGLTITLDGRALAPTEIGAMIAVDPGPHALVAQAPGRRPFERTVEGGAAGALPAVDIPALAALAAVPPATASASGSAAEGAALPGQGRRVAGYALITGGVLITLAASISGVIAIEDSRESRALCPNDHCKTQEGMDLNRSARAAAIASDILFPVGLSVAAAGVITVLLAPKPPAKGKTAVAPWVSASGGGLGVAGRW